MCVCVCVLESASFRRPGAWNRNAGDGLSTRGSCYSGIGYMDKCDEVLPLRSAPPPLISGTVSVRNAQTCWL